LRARRSKARSILSNDRRGNALTRLRRTDELGNHNYPWFQRDKNWSKLRPDAGYQRILADIKGHWERYRGEFGAG
jgi:hypothetical protein